MPAPTPGNLAPRSADRLGVCPPTADFSAHPPPRSRSLLALVLENPIDVAPDDSGTALPPGPAVDGRRYRSVAMPLRRYLTVSASVS